MIHSSNRTPEKEEEAPASFTDLGLERKSSTVVTAIGKIRHWRNIKRGEWIFLAISLSSALVSLGITIERMATVNGQSPDLTYAILLAVNTMFCFYYIIHGVFQEQVYEIFVFTLTTFIVMAYIIINYVESDQRGTVKLVRLIVICILGPINAGLGLHLTKKYWSSNNLVFRIVGGAEEMQRICRIFFLCGGLLVFDLQSQFSVIVLALKSGADVNSAETWIVSAGSVFAIAWWMIGFAALREENNILVCLFLATCPVTPAYVIYKFVDTAQNMLESSILYEVTFSAGVVAIVIRICLVVSMLFAYKNFGKGYREKSLGLPESENQVQNDVRAFADTVAEPC